MYLLFDLDGTLTDSNRLWMEVDLEFTGRRGLTVTQEYTDFVSHAIFPTSAEFTKEYYHLSESPEEIMDEWIELAYDAYAYRCPPKPGAMEFLSRCREAGVPMALVTASMPRLCQAILGRLEITGWFRFILYAQDLNLQKTDPRVWEEAVRLAGAPAEECLVFDDSPLACEAARMAGCRDVGVYDDLYAAYRTDMENKCWYYIMDFRDASPMDFGINPSLIS